MYNPREGRLRRNKYLNIGFENSPTWRLRKLMADNIVSYLDNYESEADRNPETALYVLGCFSSNKADKLFNSVLENSRYIGENIAGPIRKMMEFSAEERKLAAEILYHINSGPFLPETRNDKRKEQLK